jgi:hypothetical protein
MLCKKWPNNLPRKEQINNILFDSDTVVTRSEADPKERKDFLSMDYDLWVETRKLLQIIPIKIEFKWIESHQDSKKKKKISNGAELNIQVDKLAGDHRKSMATHIPTMKIPAGDIAIGINGIRYHHFPAAVIRKHVHERPLKEYIKSKTE